jgi:DNA-binding transcriptional regulator YiaG
MPNIAALLKTEISRLSRKEIRKEVQTLRAASTAYRREIAALKRALASLERRTKQMGKTLPSQADADGAPIEKQTRFIAKGLRSLRTRLGLSAPDLARLIGVSTQSIYNWELKKASPRSAQVSAITALRSIGKKEAQERLETMTRPKKRKAAKRASS